MESDLKGSFPLRKQLPSNLSLALKINPAVKAIRPTAWALPATPKRLKDFYWPPFSICRIIKKSRFFAYRILTGDYEGAWGFGGCAIKLGTQRLQL